MPICSNCNQDKDAAFFGKFKMCALCRTENKKERQQQRAALKLEKRFYCALCDYTAGSSTLLKSHEKSQKHEHRLISQECERLGLDAPEEKRKGTPPPPAHLRYNIADRPDQKGYCIEWRENGERYTERFSYCRRTKEEAMAEALERQAELRAE